jgi:acetyl-CoA synthetase
VIGRGRDSDLGDDPQGRLARGVRPNVADYDSARAGFSWGAARQALDGLPGGRGLNIAHEAIDRHAAGRGRDRVAVRWLRRDGRVDEVTYGQLAAATNRFANALRGLGVGPGDRVFTLLGRVPELHVAVLGPLKNRSVVCPLFSAFGPEPVRQRLDLGDGRVLVTTPALYRRKVAPIRLLVPLLEHLILVGGDGPDGDVEGAVAYDDLMSAAAPSFTIPTTALEDMALLHFTSGTTGTPKGAIHVHDAVVADHATGTSALDLHPDDVFWCTADPGWVTGMSYGVIAPLTHGVTSIVDEADFDVDRWYRILAEQKVTVWYTAPTALRMLMRAGGEAARSSDLARGPDGRAAVRDGKVEMIERPDVDGELALRPGWPSMFRGYLHDEARSRASFAGGWYLTGDVARRDADGWLWFVGRADDVINSTGHLIGPFEVESVLMEHPAVVEAGVIGVPDPVASEVVKAFVTLGPGHEPSDDLRLDLIGFARRRLGAAVAPWEIAFDQHLPKTKSGKILRRLLRARELGLPEGDLSTLEVSP